MRDPWLLQQLLRNAADAKPESTALEFADERVSYAELEQRSNQMARTLQAAGVRRGDRVGLYLNKSPSSVIGLFGALKAGAVYVPFDPGAPATRLAYIARNCDVRVLVTATGRLPQALDLAAADSPVSTVVCADGGVPDRTGVAPSVRLIDADELGAASVESPPIRDGVDTDLAYVLYTSGSTGNPKGVMIAHRTIFTFVNWATRAFALSSRDRVTSHAPLHFDLSTFDVFATLKAGGTIVQVPEGLSVVPSQLAAFLAEQRISVTYLVPSILSLMVNFGKLGTHDMSALRLVLFAGEVFPLKHLRRLVAAIPHADYYNLFGPTETNVCTYYRVRPGDVADDRTEPVPIGVPCDNTDALVVDENGSAVHEPGVVGELWIRGPGVACGYWADPERTRATFVQNPFQTRFPDPIYRTGDMVAYDADGTNLRFLGRRDHMIKSRGYRIELGDIEAALVAHAAVSEAVAVAVPDDLLGSRIHAFVVSTPGSDVTSNALLAHCRQRVPAYMVPETVTLRPDLPRTSTGKIDRQLLTRSVPTRS